jgi:hypothetical protein
MDDVIMNDNTIFLETFCTLFAHQNFIVKLIKSVVDALSYFNQCKEYYYILRVPNTDIQKRYSGKEIVNLMNQNTNSIKQYPKMDQYYFYYYKNRQFFTGLFMSLPNANKHRVNVTTYVYNMILPVDFYEKRQIQLLGKDVLNFHQYFLQNTKAYQKKYPPFPSLF